MAAHDGARLDFREEGSLWVAYFVPLQGEQPPLLLGAIHMLAVKQSSEIRDTFTRLMQQVAADSLKRSNRAMTAALRMW